MYGWMMIQTLATTKKIESQLNGFQQKLGHIESQLEILIEQGGTHSEELVEMKETLRQHNTTLSQVSRAVQSFKRRENRALILLIVSVIIVFICLYWIVSLV